MAPFRLLHDPHRRRTGPKWALSNLVDAQPKHFVAEAFAMSATLPFRELPDVRHLMESTALRGICRTAPLHSRKKNRDGEHDQAEVGRPSVGMREGGGEEKVERHQQGRKSP